MSQQLLWVGSAAGTDKVSARREEARIRSHVQSHRAKHVAKSIKGNVIDDEEVKKVPVPDPAKEVPALSLRPNQSLGRLASGPVKTASTRKQRKRPGDSSNDDPPSRKPTAQGSEMALARTLPFLWHGLSSSERRSLAFFELRTSQEWSGWEDAFFWNSLALQVSQQSQAVSRSLIAVSAFHERMEAMGSVERTRLHDLSCEQSSKATNALLARSEMPYFEALVSCLIMICFHGLRHSQASFMLLRSGVKLLAECNDPARASSEERRMVDLQLRPLFSRLLARPCGMVEMCRSFAVSVERHRNQGWTGATKKPVVPTSFIALSEARDCLQRILDWAHDHVPSQSCTSMPIEVFLASHHLLRDAWEIALAQSNFPKTAESLRSRKLLRVACLVGSIIVETAHCTEEAVFDKYLLDFEEILSLVEGAKSSGHSFGIDAGLMDIIAFVGSKCRDPQVRRHALRLLRSDVRLEGDRIASNPATILEALIALEERGLEVTSCQDVPEASRRSLVCGQQHFSQARIDLFYTSADESQKDRCCVSLAGLGNSKPSKKLSSEANVPDAIFGSGYAAYLENWQPMSYFRLELDRFYFPIPKV